MSTYRATAHREGRWWVVEVDGLGVTQGRSLAEARYMAEDYVITVLDLADNTDVEIDFHVRLDDQLEADVRDVKERIARLTEEQQAVGARSRNTVNELKDAGLSGRDIAEVLGVSPQRVSQLVSR